MKKLIVALALLVPTLSYADPLQQYQPGFRLIDGTQLNKMVGVVNNITGNGTAIPGTFTTLTATSETITSSSANALAVGRGGTTNPTLKVDPSTTSSATGLQIKSAAAASGIALSAISSGTNENMKLDAKGSGTLTLNSVATGNIVMGAAVTGVSTSLTAGLTANSGTAVPASAGALAAGAPITMFSTGIKIWVTSDAPSFSATKGDLCINTGGSSTSTRLYINNGTTNWVAITTAS